MTHYSLRVINPDEAIARYYECEFQNSLDALPDSSDSGF